MMLESGEPLYIAVDLGAGSGRVFLAGIAVEGFLLEEVRRFQYPPTSSGGYLRWDVPHIFGEIKCGVTESGERARELGGEVPGIGIYSWGVDYGLIDAESNLIEHPICYSNNRTRGP